MIKDDGDPSPNPLEPLLRGLSACYGKATGVRNRLYERRIKRVHQLTCPVISVGNIAVGGTGKTPMVIHLAQGLVGQGATPVILSRGYGGSASKEGGMVSNGERVFMTAREAGDEPLMIAGTCKGASVFVGRKRYETGQEAIRSINPDVILLDDGFQHRTLHRDLDLVLLDADRPFGNGFVLPRGPLRESVSGLERADAFILTRSDRTSDAIARFTQQLAVLGINASVLKKPVITCSHQPYVHAMKKSGDGTWESVDAAMALPGRVFAFSGIAHNKDFHKSVDALKAKMIGFVEFSDHHPYTADELDGIVSKARTSGAHAIITTEKDASRLAPDLVLGMDLWVVGVRLAFDSGESVLWDLIRNVR
jgi:tetraacyldisaccharide 4'-kinase